MGKDFLILMQHPVTTEKDNRALMDATLDALIELKLPTIAFWPNIDAGTDDVSNSIRRARENSDINNYTRFLKYLPPEKFLALLKKSRVLVGNSSAGLKECSYLGIPVVNIGNRQNGRRAGGHVRNVLAQAGVIKGAIISQWKVGRYPKDTFFYKKDSSKKIAHTLATIPLYIQKRFVE